MSTSTTPPPATGSKPWSEASSAPAPSPPKPAATTSENPPLHDSHHHHQSYHSHGHPPPPHGYETAPSAPASITYRRSPPTTSSHHPSAPHSYKHNSSYAYPPPPPTHHHHHYPGTAPPPPPSHHHHHHPQYPYHHSGAHTSAHGHHGPPPPPQAESSSPRGHSYASYPDHPSAHHPHHNPHHPHQQHHSAHSAAPFPVYRRSSWEGVPLMHVTPERTHPETFRGGACTCKKSRCLKLYCQCFASSTTCGSRCKCQNCHNSTAHGEDIEEARKTILERNPAAFEDKFPSVPSSMGMGGTRARFTATGFRESPPPPPPRVYHRSASAPLPQAPPATVMYQEPPQKHQYSTPSPPPLYPVQTSPTTVRRGSVRSTTESAQRTNKFGCNCKKSFCLKKYCDCFQNSSHCGMSCRCVNCKNMPQDATQATPRATVDALKADDVSTSTLETEKTTSSAESSHGRIPSPATARRVSNVPEETEEETPMLLQRPASRQFRTVSEPIEESSHHASSQSQLPFRRIPESSDVDRENQSRRVSDSTLDHYCHAPTEGQKANLDARDINAKNVEVGNRPSGVTNDAKASSSDPLAMMAAVAMTELFGRAQQEETSRENDVPDRAETVHIRSSTPTHESQPKRKSLTEGSSARLPPKKRRSPSPRSMMTLMNLKDNDSDEIKTKGMELMTSAISLESRDPSPVSQMAAKRAISKHSPYENLSRTAHYRSSPPPIAHAHYGHSAATPTAPSPQPPQAPHGVHYYPYPPGSSPTSHPRSSPPPYQHHQYSYHSGQSHHFAHGVPPPHPSTPANSAAKDSDVTPHSAITQSPMSASYETGLPKSLSFRKICSKCGKTRSEHGELGFGNKCVFQECGKCQAGVHVHENAGQPMGILCQLTVDEGATPGASIAYERKIRELAARADLQKELQRKQEMGELRPTESVKGC